MFDLDVDADNIMPSRYRQVTTAPVTSLDPDDLGRYFATREAYRRTRFVVARHGDRQALVELARSDDDALFSDPIGARVLAGADECVWVTDPSVDCGVSSQLATVAAEHPEARCVVVEGQYEHVTFLMNSAPIEIGVLDVVPPEPSKLVDQARRVLAVAEHLPPIILRPNLVDSRVLLAREQPDAESVLVPCRGGGVDVPGIAVSFLDERPEQQTWATLLGCQRSQQIHQWFYHEDADARVDVCPRRFVDEAAPSTTPLLVRCCLREEGIESRGSTVLVPWGSTLDEVRQALEQIAGTQDVTWTASLIDSSIFGHNWATAESQAMFSERARIKRWVLVIKALADAQAALGVIPSSSAVAIGAIDANRLDIAAIAAGTQRTSHSTLGLIHVLQDQLPEHAREHVYYGATVQDVSDTALVLEMRDLTAAAWRDLWTIEGLLVELAERHRTTPMLGRTHGQPGAPISFGYKAATWADEVSRSLARLRDGSRRWTVGQLAGAVGAMAFHGPVGPELRERFCHTLGLDAPIISWTTTRDRVAEFAAVLTIAASTLARIANEIYNLQRGEIGELAEKAGESTVGSITMPHKRNPENSEQIIVLGRVIRALSTTVSDGMVGEHERDGSTWKGEWLVVPQLSHHLLASLSLSHALVDGLIVNEKRMATNLGRYGFANSQELLRRLSVRLGKHRAQEELGRVYRLSVDTGTPIAALLVDLASADELDGLDEPALGSAPVMVDSVVSVLRARRSNESAEWT